MKQILALLATLISILCISAFNKAGQEIDEVFKILGIPETEAIQTMKENLLYASLNTPRSEKYKTIPVSERAAIVQKIGNNMKMQFRKPELAADYAAYRQSMMPGHQEAMDSMYRVKIELTPEQQEEINRQIKEFSKDYPEDVQQFIKIRLKEFLELTDDIDFNAKLIQRNGKWKFENPEYEAKDYNWKKCFRAGKETITAARSFAQQWLNELK